MINQVSSQHTIEDMMIKKNAKSKHAGKFVIPQILWTIGPLTEPEHLSLITQKPSIRDLD